METTTNIRKEFDRVFRFIVKHKDKSVNMPNAQIKKLLRWAWYYKRLFIIRDDKQIVGVSIAWRTDHPENKPHDLGIENTEFGDYLSWNLAIVHRNHRNSGLLFHMLYVITSRFPGTKRVFWTDRKGKIRIIETEKLWKELHTWAFLKMSLAQGQN